jgi:hypothetical protein
MPENPQQDDDWNRHTEQPEQDTATHDFPPFSLSFVAKRRKRRLVPELDGFKPPCDELSVKFSVPWNSKVSDDEL